MLLRDARWLNSSLKWRLAIACLAILIPSAFFPGGCHAQGVITTVAGSTFVFHHPRQAEHPTAAFDPARRETTREYLSASASLRESEKKVCLTLVNQHLTEPLEVEIHLAGLEGAGVQGGVLRESTSGNVRDENTFEKRGAVAPPSQKQVSFHGNKFTHIIPAHCVQTLLLEVA